MKKSRAIALFFSALMLAPFAQRLTSVRLQSLSDSAGIGIAAEIAASDFQTVSTQEPTQSESRQTEFVIYTEDELQPDPADERSYFDADKYRMDLRVIYGNLIMALPGYNKEYVSQLTEKEQEEAEYFLAQGFVFYRQNWSVTNNLPYGDSGFGLCGCGPTCAAAIIANLAGVPVTPEDLRVLGLQRGSYIANAGTTLHFMTSVPAMYGIKATNVGRDKEAVMQALREGKLVLATMGPGDFTLGAHFMLYRGVTEDGKILISDSYSFEHSVQEWDWDTLARQLKNGYWIYEKE